MSAFSQKRTFERPILTPSASMDYLSVSCRGIVSGVSGSRGRRRLQEELDLLIAR